jgi:hypothetical protein
MFCIIRIDPTLFTFEITASLRCIISNKVDEGQKQKVEKLKNKKTKKQKKQNLIDKGIWW